MFLVDVSNSMKTTRKVPLPPGPDGAERFAEMTHLEYALQYVKFKIQTMVFAFFFASSIRMDYLL